MSKDKDSPSPEIDKAIADMLKDLKGADVDPELRIKTVQLAINWQKAKHAIKGDEEFDPHAEL